MGQKLSQTSRLWQREVAMRNIPVQVNRTSPILLDAGRSRSGEISKSCYIKTFTEYLISIGHPHEESRQTFSARNISNPIYQ